MSAKSTESGFKTYAYENSEGNQTDMRELTTVDTFDVTGRGTAHVVAVGDTAPKLHEYVLLDGKACEVTGVEWPVRNGYAAFVVRVEGNPK